MTSIHHTPARGTIDKTMSFGTHRQSDRPASAIRAGASSMPSAWQSRGIPTGTIRSQYDAPPRSFADLAMDPVRWIKATRTRQLTALLGICVAAYILIF